MLAAGDFVLRRVLKFVLKRSLRNIIKTNLDLDQLSVTLGEGRLELREVLLSTDYLNQHLVRVCEQRSKPAGPRSRGAAARGQRPLRVHALCFSRPWPPPATAHARSCARTQAGLPWEVTAAFVGSVAAAIPLAALYSDSCVVRLDEVFLTLRPRTAAPPPAAKPPGAEHQPVPGSPSGAAAAGAGASETAGESAVAEGVKLIAGGLEALLQRMRVAATRVVLRLELPAGEAGPRGACHVVTLSLGQAEYCGSSSGLPGVPDGAEAAGEQAPAAVRVTKSLSFSGLTLELQPAQARAPEPAEACLLLGTSAEGSAAGCSGVVDVQLAWGLRPHARPRVSLAARLDPLQVQLRPQDVLALAAVAAAAARLPGAFAAAATQPERQAASAPPMGVSSALEHPGSRSFIEGLMLPDCEGLVAEALQTPPLGRGGADSITGQVGLPRPGAAASLHRQCAALRCAGWCQAPGCREDAGPCLPPSLSWPQPMPAAAGCPRAGGGGRVLRRQVAAGLAPGQLCLLHVGARPPGRQPVAVALWPSCRPPGAGTGGQPAPGP